MKREITLEINGREETITVEDADTLLEVLRDRFKLWSVRRAAVLERAEPAPSCSTVAPSVLASCLRFASPAVTSRPLKV